MAARRGRRSTRKRQSQRVRRLAVVILILIVVVGSVGFFYLVINKGTVTQQPGNSVPPSLYSQLYSAATGPYGSANSTYVIYFLKSTQPPYFDGDKPVIVYIGGEFCGLCAGERWPLLLALMRFGNFTNLGLAVSSSTEQFPNIDSFSFAGSVYSSPYISFQPYEVWDEAGNFLHYPPSNYTANWNATGLSIPYLNFGNDYLLNGTFSPRVLQGLSWAQIVASVQSGQGAGVVIKQLTNAMTAVICGIDGERPQIVCSDAAIANFALLDSRSPVAGAGAGFILAQGRRPESELPSRLGPDPPE